MIGGDIISEYIVEDTELIKNTKVYGLNESIRRAKFPYATDVDTVDSTITGGIAALAGTPVGHAHDNWLNGVIVQFDLEYTIKAWAEAERYTFLDFISSQSTIHKICSFSLDNKYDDHVDGRIVEIMKELVSKYNESHDKDDYLKVLMSNPCGFKLIAGMTTNYRQLKTIYLQRRNHLLPEWRSFCSWVETLPMASVLIMKGAID